LGQKREREKVMTNQYCVGRCRPRDPFQNNDNVKLNDRYGRMILEKIIIVVGREAVVVCYRRAGSCRPSEKTGQSS
jgi:hypothetical protein